ncbi:MAG TPA: bis(5'-nucleosyl)-tetraphosphatase (symmetrical) YqeK [Candidatus Acidoferrales bacterium]|nr:bis(5'-nucleosyl)-tetraphosphatase (symmetrical) YqeK [Candidatus Acidoferrales bacterium]
MTYGELRRRVRAHIGQDHRYAHVVRVARLAEALARAHGISTARARAAGMLHDLARLLPARELLLQAQARGLTVDAFERENPIVLHARLGAEIAREQFGVKDEGILSAIRKHTVADATMSPLDAVVYLADGLEPARDFPERPELLAAAMDDLDEGMRRLLAQTATYLQSRGLAVAPQTLAALDTYAAKKETLCPN